MTIIRLQFTKLIITFTELVDILSLVEETCSSLSIVDDQSIATATHSNAICKNFINL